MRAGERVLEGCRNFSSKLNPHLRDGCVVEQAVVAQKRPIACNGIVHRPILQFAEVTISGFAVIACAAMCAETVDPRLDKARPGSRTRALDCLPACLVDREYVGTVDS